MKKIVIVLGICTAIYGVTAGTTYAYLFQRDHVENELTFIGEKGIDAVLTEPSWNPEKAKETIPGKTIPKDPQVTNTSEMDMDLLTALQVEFVYGVQYPEVSKRGKLLSESDMAAVCQVYEANWNADLGTDSKWVRFAGETEEANVQHFYYTDALKRNLPEDGDTTTPLFTQLSVKKDAGNKQFQRIQEMNGFDMKISGVVVQQMNGESEFGLYSGEAAYQNGVFQFIED